MGFDIYGHGLQPGHCEVHPNIPEPYPCSICLDGGHPLLAAARRCGYCSAEAVVTVNRRRACVGHLDNAFGQVATQVRGILAAMEGP
jgi:hypothetical protein